MNHCMQPVRGTGMPRAAFSSARPAIQNVKRRGDVVARYDTGARAPTTEDAVENARIPTDHGIDGHSGISEAEASMGVGTAGQEIAGQAKDQEAAAAEAVDAADAQAMAEAVEAAEKAEARALQELEDRVVPIYSEDDLVDALDKAGDALVVLEVMADEVCESGYAEPDDGWTPDQDAIKERKLAKCTQIKHAFMRMAAESPDVRFLSMLGTDLDAERTEFSERLGVKTYPTVIFFKHNRIIWTSSGSTSLEHDMKQGVLYFGNSLGKRGFKPNEHVQDLAAQAELDGFIKGDGVEELQCLMVTDAFCSPCVHIYPSVVTLAMNFKGVVSFARLGNVESSDTRGMLKKLKVLEVPTFIMYKDGAEVGRIVTGNRGALIGHILEVVARHGITLPAPSR